jgi:hypothetical protein
VAKHPQRPGRLVLAIECDGASYHSAYTARDRDRLRQQHLEALGWRFHRIWSTDWFMRRAQEIERAVAAYHAAVADCDAAELAHPAPAPQTDEIKPGVAAGEEQIIRTASNVNFGPPRPHIPKRQSIDEYALAELVAAVEWIESDGKLRTDEEVVEEAIRMLGFSRKGNRIEAALRNAIAYSRQHPPAGHNGKPQPPG